MFDQSYPFRYANKSNAKVGKYAYIEHKLTCFSHDNHQYIINVEEYDFEIFIVKFHLKSHTLSDNRYSLLTGFHDAPRLIRTCVNVMLDFYKKYPYASFGFIGANSLEENENKTKRFRIYQKVMENFFSPVDFEHFVYEEKSAYIMVNRNKNEQGFLAKIQEMFLDIYLKE